MTAARRYSGGLLAIALGVVVLGIALPGDARNSLWLALVAAVVLQGPLGWWLLRSVGRSRFLLVWAIGMVARFALLALLAWIVVPALGWPALPALVGFAAILFALLLLEALVLLLEHSHVEAR